MERRSEVRERDAAEFNAAVDHRKGAASTAAISDPPE
jgi:hypothetical protein